MTSVISGGLLCEQRKTTAQPPKNVYTLNLVHRHQQGFHLFHRPSPQYLRAIASSVGHQLVRRSELDCIVQRAIQRAVHRLHLAGQVRHQEGDVKPAGEEAEVEPPIARIARSGRELPQQPGAARSACRSMAGPLVTRIGTPSSCAMTFARLVFPTPGGPKSATCSSGSFRAFAASMRMRILPLTFS